MTEKVKVFTKHDIIEKIEKEIGFLKTVAMKNPKKGWPIEEWKNYMDFAIRLLEKWLLEKLKKKTY